MRLTSTLLSSAQLEMYLHEVSAALRETTPAVQAVERQLGIERVTLAEASSEAELIRRSRLMVLGMVRHGYMPFSDYDALGRMLEDGARALHVLTRMAGEIGEQERQAILTRVQGMTLEDHVERQRELRTMQTLMEARAAVGPGGERNDEKRAEVRRRFDLAVELLAMGDCELTIRRANGKWEFYTRSTREDLAKAG